MSAGCGAADSAGVLLKRDFLTITSTPFSIKVSSCSKVCGAGFPAAAIFGPPWLATADGHEAAIVSAVIFLRENFSSAFRTVATDGAAGFFFFF